MQKTKRQPESAAPLRYTTACFYFARGLCDRGTSCAFAHCTSDLRSKPDLSRTSLCRTFMKAGLCTAGGECTYAHGRVELRRPRKNVQEPGPVPFDSPDKPVNQIARKKQTAASKAVSLKPAKLHRNMSAQHEPMKELGRRSDDDNAGSRGARVSSCFTLGDSSVKLSDLFGNARGIEESERDLDGAEFETAHGNNSGFGHIVTVMTVKNTFLHFDEKVSAEMTPVRRMAKSSSAPQLVAA
ncbi:unnamed protein product [Polarella glacialis]|uniref:C3H1-type domain-containing protein n=1 Tax=Polarella glacialis TaxID=89957 RepID=A0A813GSN4_POLGL|nr:unnamed protein product [Polarella glacialis]CAE8629555.1 unnamed protein product [Polarella glacialis]